MSVCIFLIQTFLLIFFHVIVWAPGDGPFALPDFLGAPLFGPDGYQSFSMEVHYDNPRKCAHANTCVLIELCLHHYH